MPQIVICLHLPASSEIGTFLAESFQQENLLCRRKTQKMNEYIFIVLWVVGFEEGRKHSGLCDLEELKIPLCLQFFVTVRRINILMKNLICPRHKPWRNTAVYALSWCFTGFDIQIFQKIPVSLRWPDLFTKIICYDFMWD